ncbi:unnamed protein product [Vitrella brassicaformis CCMP3155]|uniref:FAS1 domain-containing protein n=2 Tax=Vitrella brassicaformis TaxID=1169539 RepID=A0A0G4EAR5_VITBC|nr:unnamed protein product [Vitrella brassicaformis CCMP3155]|mmetsp:Transcript_10302/g.24927  ORF Transcript_10302/g.24927 Transcript_10302/m.24927 type:complete len:198 (+) Transcript_10302:132-725(+)|eukprot:CEL92382.1 unnamed protein product [Vitrella brassicaformis CCMP3155]
MKSFLCALVVVSALVAVSAFHVPVSPVAFRGGRRAARPTVRMATIGQEIAQNPELSKLLEMIRLAGINLSSGGPYTFFAPVNSAWEKMPPRSRNRIAKDEHRDVLKDTLLYHVLTAKKTSSDIAGSENVQTVYQRENDFSSWPSANVPVMVRKMGSGTMMANSAKVIKPDIICDDGVIHLVDKVFFPYVHDQAGWGK